MAKREDQPAEPRPITAAADPPGGEGTGESSGESSGETTGESSQKPSPSEAAPDLLYVHSRCEAGEGFNVVRQRQDRVEIGELREVREGKPVMGEVVRLSQREGQERLFDVEVLYDGAKSARRQAVGPARISSNAYRDNWDAIFGGSDEATQASKTELN